VIWPAILLSAGIDLPKLILVHGYITVEGEKMSKSKGTVVNPLELAKKYPIDSIRYFLLRETAFGEDGDFTMKSLVERTNNELVANVGNFIHRTLTFISKYFNGVVPKPVEFSEVDEEFVKRIESIADIVAERLERFELDKALKDVLEFSDEGNRYFQLKEPWKDKDPTCLYLCANAVRSLAVLLEPFVPGSMRRLWSQLNLEGNVSEQKWQSASKLLIDSGHKIGKPKILFKKI
jgi:methionyl-tRNA synthetase